MGGGAGAHEARLESRVEAGPHQALGAQGLAGGADREHFAVGCGIGEAAGLVVTAAQDVAVKDNHGTHGNLVQVAGQARLVQGGSHEALVGIAAP